MSSCLTVISVCSLKTIYCHCCKPAEVEMDGGQNKKENGERTRGRKQRWGGCRNEKVKDGNETVLVIREKREGSMD